MNWIQGVLTLVGVLIGGGISLLTTRWSHTQQSKDERERAASLIAREAVVKLRQLDPKPSEEFEHRSHWAMRRNQPRPPEEDRPAQELDDAWIKERNNWLLQLQVVIGDFSDDDFRQRLDDMHTAFIGADTWWDYIGTVESVTRHRICHHLLDLLGRHGRGASLAPMPKDVQNALHTVQDQIEIWERHEEWQKQEVERMRQAKLEARAEEDDGSS
ncbi:hypothetical protein [Nonomuraea insulae]|uniref:DUF4760 domain-containing protein n=1 Tax=Nonomuraea insulae TaxID=1616787 RepID=A0ABW1DC97_9ACTN